jgi:Sec-independent protein translocase protein TatA
MWKKIRWFIPPLVIVILILILIFGREKPPTLEVENAEKAIAEAKQKEADIYVPDIFSKAEETLKKAKDLMREKKYKEAKKAAEDTINLAKQAISQVEPNKSKMKAEAEEMISDIRKGIDELKSLIAKPSKRMTKRERKELEELIQKWEKDLVNIEAMMEAKKIRQAYDQLMGLKKEIDSKRERFIPSPEEKKGIK